MHKKKENQLGGLALQNGVLMIGPTAWAAAVETTNGETRVHSAPRLNERYTRWSHRVPLLRGPMQIISMVSVLVELKKRLPDAKLSYENPITIGALIATQGASILSKNTRSELAYLPKIAASLITAGATYMSLRQGELAQWHGAEHKSIAAYEQDKHSYETSRIHTRCGTQLLPPMLLYSALAAALAHLFMPKHRRHETQLIRQILALGLAVETVRSWQNQSHPNRLSRWLRNSGYWLQENITTSEPTGRQLSVADQALTALLDAERAPKPGDKAENYGI